MEKESNRFDYQRTFFPHVLWLYSIAALVLSTVALWAYVGAFILLLGYEYLLVQPNVSTPVFFRSLSRYFFLFLGVFILVYGFFLKVGSHAWFSIDIAGYTWVWTYESLAFGVHYAVVLVVLLWIAYLIGQQKRISSLQYYFTGSLYPLTILWNHTLHTLDQMMTWKAQYQKALQLRHIKMGTVAYMKNMVLFVFDRAFWEVRGKLPVMVQRWQQPNRSPASWVEKTLFVLPVLFFVLAFFSSSQQVPFSNQVYGLLWGGSLWMMFDVYRRQRISLQMPPQWLRADRMALCALVCVWIMYSYGPYAPWKTSIIDDISIYSHVGLSQMSILICLGVGLFFLTWNHKEACHDYM